MALDEALMDSVREGARPVLRFYRWSPACLSLGRNQPASGRYDLAEIARRKLDVVRRPTGGRAVVHARELTYSVIVPERALGTLREAYAAVNRALSAAVRALGVPATLQPRSQRRAAVPSLVPCFHDPAEGEVVVGGRKLIGSAQYRQRGVLLQHGSLLLENDQALLAGLVPGEDETEDAPAVLADFLDPAPAWEVMTSTIARAWAEESGALVRAADPSAGERDRAGELQPKYAGMAWTWRR